jgi:hypothetical protein
MILRSSAVIRAGTHVRKVSGTALATTMIVIAATITFANYHGTPESIHAF